MRIFAGASTSEELDRRLNEEVQHEVSAMLEIFGDLDAFDVIELVRLRELPIVPVAGLEPGYDGNGAVIDLVSLVLLARGSRTPGAPPHVDTQPSAIIPSLHDAAARMVRLGTYRAQTSAALRADDPLARLAAEYQSYLVSVRGLQYDSVQSRHDAALFARPEIEALLIAHLGFSYQDFMAVRTAIQERYSDTLTRLRDTTADIVMTTRSEGRAPTATEIETVQDSMQQWMFLPGERAAFTVADIVQLTGIEPARVQAVLAAFSMDFNDQLDAAEVVKRFLRGVNPLARTSLIRDSDGRHLMTGIQIGSDSFRAVAEASLKQSNRSWQRYDKVRAEVSETLALDALAKLLGTQPSHVNVKYMAPKEGVAADALGPDCADLHVVANQTENDGLFLIEDVAICVEVKGRTVADAARRGDHARLKTEIDNIFGSGTMQARRLETLIRTNEGLWLEDGSWLDLGHVREIRSIVVGLDFFGPLAVALGDLQRAGLLGTGSLPWIVGLHDLDVICSVLDRPTELLLYLRRRTDSGVALHYRGSDELDLFMLFMDGGLYVEQDPDEVRQLHPSGGPVRASDRRRYQQDARPTIVGTYTDPLDAWMYWIEGTSPEEAAKPTFNSHESACQIVDFLADGNKPGWFRFGADLLGLSGEAQQRLGDNLRTLAERTRTDHQWHTLVQGFAGMWGHPSLFAGTAPQDLLRDTAVKSLRQYMTAKRYQLRSDRSLGLVLDEGGDIVHVLYANNLLASSPELDALVTAVGLQPVGSNSRRSRGTRSRRGSKEKRRRQAKRKR
jgi:hypothetical protein